LQVALHRSREALRDLGVVVPGKGTRPRKAVWSLLGAPEGIERPDIRHWHRLVGEVEQAGDARVCISTEDWARTDLEGATQVVEGLGGERPHIVATGRRLDKLLPSQWQQRVKMRRITHSYEEWLEIVLGDDSQHPAWRNIWIPHDIEAVTDRWAKAAGGPENVTLIVADESDRDLLPRTFERLLGIPAGMLSEAASDVRNQSIGFGRAEAIRHLTKVADANRWSEDPGLEALHGRLTDAFKSEAPWPDEARVPALPTWAAERVRELSERRAAAVRSLGVRVVGDPDNLRMPEAPSTPTIEDPGMVSAELAARIVEKAVALLEEQHAEALSRRERQIARLRKGGARSAAPSVDEVGARDLLKVVARRGVRRISRR
jgi:hypothetical protein